MNENANTINEPVKTNAQRLYEAYCSHTGWKSLVSGAPLPPWSEVKPEIKEAWDAAGKISLSPSGIAEIAELMDASERLMEWVGGLQMQPTAYWQVRRALAALKKKGTQ